MEVIDQSLQLQTLGNTIEDVPDEVLEFIIGFLPPYKDLQNCMCVCKRWYNCAQSEFKHYRNNSIILKPSLINYTCLNYFFRCK